MRLKGELALRGEVVWLTAEQGGRASGPPPTAADQDYAATGFVPPSSSADGLASFVIRAADRTAWRSAATARWLVLDNSEMPRIEAGTVIVVTEGLRPVAYFHLAVVPASD
jgi:hypothetical protein